jgi:hypothetical protein
MTLALLGPLQAQDGAGACGVFPALGASRVQTALNIFRAPTARVEAEVLPLLHICCARRGNNELRRDAASNEREAQTQSNVKVSHRFRLSHVIRRVHGGRRLLRAFHTPGYTVSRGEFPSFFSGFVEPPLHVAGAVLDNAQVVPPLHVRRPRRRNDERGCGATDCECESDGQSDRDLGHTRSVTRPRFAVHGRPSP